MGYTSAVRKCIHVEIRNTFNLIHEREWTGETVSIMQIFARDTVPPERVTTSGRTGTSRKE
jgi:hypothetical protein